MSGFYLIPSSTSAINNFLCGSDAHQRPLERSVRPLLVASEAYSPTQSTIPWHVVDKSNQATKGTTITIIINIINTHIHLEIQFDSQESQKKCCLIDLVKSDFAQQSRPGGPAVAWSLLPHQIPVVIWLQTVRTSSSRHVTPQCDPSPPPIQCGLWRYMWTVIKHRNNNK